MERRTFIRYVGTLGTALVVFPQLVGCDTKSGKIKVTRIGADFDRGHLLRNLSSVPAGKKTRSISVKTLIIGGGISGLSTAYHLKKSGEESFLVLEMNQQPGGNSAHSGNRHSDFPLGAHYLSLPNPTNTPLIDFLKSIGLITGEHAGQQTYNETHLCHAPDERLLFRGVFHEGFVPDYGLDAETRQEIGRFFELMNTYRHSRSEDGKDLFNIPISATGASPFLDELDQQSFDAFLKQHNFKSEELLWFLDYCCRDDFGAGTDRISAWAGIHYFAARKATPTNTDPTSVLTWPEGNGYLVNQLKTTVSDKIATNVLVHSVTELEDRVIIKAVDFGNDETLEIIAEKCVLSCPSYVSKRILHSPYWDADFFNDYVHHPWLVGIVVLDKFPDSNGTPLAWDNVKFGTKGLGYVHNQHQSFKQHHFQHVISVYYAFDKDGDQQERRTLFQKTDDELVSIVVHELKSMHPDIEEMIVSITFQLWGHGMVTPYPGSLQKRKAFIRQSAQAKRVHLAHTDYSGYSVFEEGFDIGYRIANQLSDLL
jgi:protoporphyrinogen oxidase